MFISLTPSDRLSSGITASLTISVNIIICVQNLQLSINYITLYKQFLNGRIFCKPEIAKQYVVVWNSFCMDIGYTAICMPSGFQYILGYTANDARESDTTAIMEDELATR